MLAFGKFGFYRKGKEFFFCGHLKNGRIVIAEMIIGPLHKSVCGFVVISMRSCETS